MELDIPKFKTDKELYDFIVANEDIIIAQKKSAIKEADGFSYISIPIKNGSIGKAESQESLVN